MDTNKLMPLLSEMATFVTVADNESFSKAGKKLNQAPSSVSRSISRLEAALGCKLLERTTRKVSLNPKGREVFELCSSMLSSAKMAANAAQSIEGEVSGALRIAAPKALCKQVLAPIVLNFAQAYPLVKVTLLAVDHFIDPISDEVDVIIRLTNQPIEGLIAKTLSHSKLILCACPDYLDERGIPKTPDDLAQHDCITLGEEAGDDVWHFSNKGEKTKIKVRERFSANHTQIRREAAIRGMGIAIFPDFSIQDTLDKGELVPVLADWRLLGKYQGDIIAQYAQSKYIPTQIRTFISYLQGEFE